jgi:hypothetical protein
LLALLRPSIKGTDFSHTSAVAKYLTSTEHRKEHQHEDSRALQLVTRKKHTFNILEVRSSKTKYLLSPLQVATGNYTTRTSLSTLVSYLDDSITSSCNDSQTTLIVHPLYGSHNRHPSRIYPHRRTYLTPSPAKVEIMETPEYTDTYAAFARPLTLNPPPRPWKAGPSLNTRRSRFQDTWTSNSSFYTSPVHFPLQPILDSLFPSESTRAVGDVAKESLKTRLVSIRGKIRGRRIVPVTVPGATGRELGRRCPVVFNEVTGFYEPLNKAQQKLHLKKAAILAYSGQLPLHDIRILDEAEQESNGLMNDLEPKAAPLFDPAFFGCSYDTWCYGTGSEQQAEIKTFPMSLYHAINLAKQEYGIDEFNPSSLIDGQIKPDTYEADFRDEIPEGLHGLFVKYLDHLVNLCRQTITSKKWKPTYRLQRTEAEFEDNFALYNILGLDDPLRPIPFGHISMIEEYWARKGLEFDIMIEHYFYKERQHALANEDDWLTGDEEAELNYHKYAKFAEPLQEPMDMEIKELERLPVEEVDDHSVFASERVIARAYEAWEPEVVYWEEEMLVGEERYPDCPEGETAWKVLQTYRKDAHPPIYEEYMAGKMEAIRWDSGTASPVRIGQLPWVYGKNRR